MANPNKTVRLARILFKPFQQLENAQQQLLQRSVDNSEGLTLTLFGKLVGQKRAGVLDDEIFRRYVRARIATNKSTMVGEDIITISKLVVGDSDAVIVLENTGDAAFELTVEGVITLDDIATVLLTFLRVAVGTGIRVIVITWPAVEADMFAFDGGEGSGWGDSLDPDTGGVFASGRD